jgi:hypothetical protein
MSLVDQSIIKHKMGLPNLAEELQNVSQACRVMSVSQDTFYRVKEAKDSRAMGALLHKDRRQADMKNRMDQSTEAVIPAFALENLAAGRVQVSNELGKQRRRSVFATLNHIGDGGSGNAFNASCTASRSCGACAMAML